MSLSERLEALKAPGSNIDPVRSPAPSGWEPGVKYEADGSRVVTLPPTPELADESSWAAAVEALGVSVPDGYRVRLVEAKYDAQSWARDEEFRVHPQTGRVIKSPAITRPVWRYRFVVEVAPARIDVDDLLRAVRKRSKQPTQTGASGAAYLFAIGDMQLGKSDGDGTAGTVERFYLSLERAVARYKALRKAGRVEAVTLLVAGDCIEGTVSQGGNLISRNDLTLTEMIRVYRRLLADEVQSFAALTDHLTVAVVPGNHDEATRTGNQMSSTYDDSWAIEGASQVADVMSAKGYDIGWLFPGHDEMHLTLDVAGTRVGLLHGHQTKGKMQPWLANKAMSRDPIGTADLCISGHYHHLRLEQMGPTTWMQTGSLDGGSTWWAHKGGLDAPPAALTMIVGGGKWTGLEVV